MNKELTPSEALEKIINDYKCGLPINTKNIRTIENALKKIEKQEEIVWSTTLDEALKQFLIDRCPEIKKKLKALEIIKKKKVDCLLITISQTVMDYNDMCEEDNVNLAQEEFDLLKEVLL